MSIQTITIEELRRMEGKEGIILQGCGGPAQEWLDGINDLFTKEGLLKDGSKFTDCAVFDNAGVTCILYPFEGVQLELGKLAIWRLQTYDQFFGAWLSDYVENPRRIDIERNSDTAKAGLSVDRPGREYL